MNVSEHSIVQTFIPKQVYDIYGDKSAQFISDNVVKMYEGIYLFFDKHFKSIDSNVERIEVVVNNWHDINLIKILGGQVFNWRGLRTVDYIMELIKAGQKVAHLSQHIGGSTNAIDHNVILYFKGGKFLVVNSQVIYDLILKNESYFLGIGLTTLENKLMTVGWTHADCRFTGLKNIYIVNP